VISKTEIVYDEDCVEGYADDICVIRVYFDRLRIGSSATLPSKIEEAKAQLELMLEAVGEAEEMAEQATVRERERRGE